MKRAVLVGALAAALGMGAAYARTPQAGRRSSNTRAQASTPQSPVPIPQKPVTVAIVRIPRAVKADNQPLKPGRYQVRLLGDPLKAATGETPGLEQWIEFVQHGKVQGKAVASVVPRNEIHQIAEGRIPAPGHARVDVLKGNDYVRIWINRKGTNYLIHLPTEMS